MLHIICYIFSLFPQDFGDSIPGHGGITDRMDCQVRFYEVWIHKKSVSTMAFQIFFNFPVSSKLFNSSDKLVYHAWLVIMH